MSADRRGAVRAAVLLNLLVDSSAPIPYQSFEDELRWNFDNVPAGRSFDQLRRRAVNDLRQWGADVIDDGRTLRLDRSVTSLASRQRLPITSEQARFRDRIASVLRTLDPRHHVDEMAVLKAHVPQDRLAITYGADAQLYQGVPYKYVGGDRPRLLVRTDDGDLAFWADAIRSVSLIAPSFKRVGDGDPDPPLVSAKPVQGAWRNQAGRPPDVVVLRHAQRVLAAIRSSISPNPEEADDLSPTVSYRSIARLTRHREREVRSVAAVVHELDHAIVPDDDGFTIYPSHRATVLDGAQALIARLELAAVRALGGVQTELDPGLRDDALDSWESLLKEFLSHAEMPDAIDDETPCAANIVAALVDGDAEPFEVVVEATGAARNARLRVEGLQWHQLRWWVTGRLDDKIVIVGELPLAAIRAIEL